VNDVTARKQAEAEINILNDELEKRVEQRTLQLENANNELEAFSYSVAHNLRSPLRGIDGWSMALLEEYNNRLDDQGIVYLNRVRNQAQQMGELIDDLLKLSRVTRLEMQYNEVDLTGIAKALVTQLSEVNPGRQFDLKIENGLSVPGDESMLQIALTNLLENAFKFTGPKPLSHIEFGRLNANGSPAFYIRDNGVGFNQENSKNIFGAFQRMHKQSDFPGTGIGLAIVDRVISRHGGHIWAESKPGEGATFYFTINQPLPVESVVTI
jgi:light-regulated signal transduction histidine kinase (bacteriophytochrome)